MKLQSIEVRRLPGIDRPYRVEGLASSVNLVVGPNGIGKSTLCRAVGATLWPGGGRPDDEVTTVWDRGKGSSGDGKAKAEGERASAAILRADLVGGVRWTDGAGRDVPAPAPDPALRRCLLLGMSDLLQVSADDDRALAERLRVQMAGGFDLEAVAQGVLLGARHGRAEERALSEARRVLRDVEGERRALGVEADSLDGLRARAVEARRAVREVARLRRVAELAVAQRELREIDRQLDEYPREIALLHGDELGRLKDFDRECDAIGSELVDAQRRADRADRERAACRLPDGAIDDASVQASLMRARNLRELEQELARLERVEAAALAEWTEERRRLSSAEIPLAAAAMAAPPLGRAELEAFEGWTAEAFQLAEARTRLVARQAQMLAEAREAGTGLGTEADVEAGRVARDPIAVARQAIDSLDAWVGLAAAPRRPAWRALAVGVLAGGLAAASFATARMVLQMRQVDGLARFLGALDSPAALLLGALGATAIAGIAWSLARPPGRRRRRRDIEARYATCARELGAAFAFDAAEPPDLDAVETMRLALARAITATEDARRRENELGGLTGRLVELEQGEARLEAQRAEFVERLGVDPRGRALGLADLLDRLQKIRGATARLEAARAERTRCQVDRTERLDRLSRELRAGSPGTQLDLAEPSEPLDDAAAVEGALEDLRDRGAAWRLAEAELETAARDIDRCERQLEELRHRRDELLAKAGHAEGDSREVRQLLEEHLGQLDRFKDTRDRAAEVRGHVAGLRADLEDVPELLALPEDEIAERIAVADQSAGELEDVSRRIAVIEERVKQATEGDALASALEGVGRAEATLRERAEERLLAEASAFLLEEVEDEYEQQSRPAVLSRAIDLFEAFSRRRYSLRLGRGGAGASRTATSGTATSFRAVEVETGRERALGELSDGTRMQLLLAARLAFVIEAETGAPEGSLPLFLDEALTATDPQRFRAVVESLGILAEQGRQIFYLTCSPADVEHWRRVAREGGAPEPHVVDLGVVRGRAAAAGEVGLCLPPREDPPAPTGEGAEAYGARLAVPAVDPLAPAGTLHLFHLLRDDLELLHRVLRDSRIETLGPWRVLRAGGGRVDSLTEAEHARIDALGDLAEGMLASLRVGRSRPVDRGVLYQSGALSETFLDRLAALAEDLGGDAEQLVAALECGEDERAKRFQKAKLAQLVEFLKKEGHLVDVAPLELGELQARAQAQMAPVIEAGVLASAEVSAWVGAFHALIERRVAGA